MNVLTAGAFIAFVMALVLMLITGSSLIVWLREQKWGGRSPKWQVREDTPDSHKAKQGVPSMGGIGIALCVALTLLSAVLLQLATISKSWQYGFNTTASTMMIFLLTQLPLPFIYFGHTILGFIDDRSKATERGGLRARSKFTGQIVLAFAFIALVVFMAQAGGLNVYTGDLFLDFADAVVGNWWWAVPLIIVSIVAMTNAVNLTDGLDGLAPGLAIQSLVGLALISDAWTVQYILFAVAGACLGFLAFNRHPARIFMGDTGSLALGGLIGGTGILLGGFFLLPFVGFIFLVEMMSVVLQVLWFKYTRRKTGEGQRLFKRAPLHHHFELSGWSEWRVVLTFWGINLITTILGLWLWSNELLPRWPL